MKVKVKRAKLVGDRNWKVHSQQPGHPIVVLQRSPIQNPSGQPLQVNDRRRADHPFELAR